MSAQNIIKESEEFLQRRIQQEIDRYVEDYNRVEAHNKKLDKNLDILGTKLQLAEEIKAELVRKNENLKEEIKKLMSVIRDLEDAKNREAVGFQRKINELELKVQKAKDEVEVAKNRSDMFKEQHDSLVQEKNKLADRLKNYEMR